MIREATAADLPRMVEMVRQSPGYESAPTDAIAATLERCACFISADGLICGALHPSMFDPARLMASEVFWRPERGLAVAQANTLRAWARESGAHEVRLCSAAAGRQAEAVARRMSMIGMTRMAAVYREVF